MSLLEKSALENLAAESHEYWGLLCCAVQARQQEGSVFFVLGNRE
jgi:hypothetical protein